MTHNITILLATILFLSGCKQEQPEKKSENKKPNILFIMADDHAIRPSVLTDIR